MTGHYTTSLVEISISGRCVGASRNVCEGRGPHRGREGARGGLRDGVAAKAARFLYKRLGSLTRRPSPRSRGPSRVPPYCEMSIPSAVAELVEAAARRRPSAGVAHVRSRGSSSHPASAAMWRSASRTARARCSATARRPSAYTRRRIERLRAQPACGSARAGPYALWRVARRERRRLDARDPLRHRARGSPAWRRGIRRARRARAAGHRRERPQTPRTRSATSLRPEIQIARLARRPLEPRRSPRADLSPHTVAYHMRNGLSKLDITSRNQLDGACPATPSRAILIVRGSCRRSARRFHPRS